MTLAELGMAFWHNLAAPVIAGNSCQYDRELAEQAEVTCHAGVRLP